MPLARANLTLIDARVNIRHGVEILVCSPIIHKTNALLPKVYSTLHCVVLQCVIAKLIQVQFNPTGRAVRLTRLSPNSILFSPFSFDP